MERSEDFKLKTPQSSTFSREITVSGILGQLRVRYHGPVILRPFQGSTFRFSNVGVLLRPSMLGFGRQIRRSARRRMPGGAQRYEWASAFGYGPGLTQDSGLVAPGSVWPHQPATAGCVADYSGSDVGIEEYSTAHYFLD